MYVRLTADDNFDPDYTISLHAPSQHRTGSKTMKDSNFREDIIFSYYSTSPSEFPPRFPDASVEIRVQLPIMDSYFSGLYSYEDLTNPEFMAGMDYWYITISNPSYYPKSYDIYATRVYLYNS